MNYYNEFDPPTAEWLRELIRAGEIPDGKVDERSIKEVQPGDLAGYVQCHFFAGIGGWAEALRLSGWHRDRPVWTGSCPCQPYSAAGKGLGAADPRDLWPEFYRLIRQCRPVVCFGEQVEKAVRYGWYDRVCADLEVEGYTCGSVVLGAHSATAPHQRQRLYWVADANGRIAGDGRIQPGGEHRQQPGNGGVSGMAAARYSGPERWSYAKRPAGDNAHSPVGVSDGTGSFKGRTTCASDGYGNTVDAASCVGNVHSPVGDTDSAGSQGRGVPGSGRKSELPIGSAGGASFWDDWEPVSCRDGKTRRTKPGIFPLAHGVPARVVKLRGSGNAIVPQTAALFIKAWREVRGV